MTTIPWKRALVSDVTVVDALAPSRVSSFVTAKAVLNAEERKISKYSDPIGQGDLFKTPHSSAKEELERQ